MFVWDHLLGKGSVFFFGSWEVQNRLADSKINNKTVRFPSICDVRKLHQDVDMFPGWWQLKHFWNFYPYLPGEVESNLRNIFFKGVGSTTNYSVYVVYSSCSFQTSTRFFPGGDLAGEDETCDWPEACRRIENNRHGEDDDRYVPVVDIWIFGSFRNVWVHHTSRN